MQFNGGFSVLVVARYHYGSGGPNHCSYDLGIKCSTQCRYSIAY